ncbi:MAG: hypothetical protein JST54_14340 [Deltaproteobacteria bacterium]|nr:hypothetical protein [Deltaproteobacteria bacterium]
MIAPLLALALTAQPKVFLSVDRAFLPDAPGAVVRAELEGATTLDVRLYQLKDPERFLSGADDVSAVSAAPPANAARAASPPAVLARGAAGLRQSLHTEVESLLTDAAQSALKLLAPGDLVDAPRELPFLRGEPLLRRWIMPCGGAEAHHYCDVDLGPLPSGVYLVEGVAGAQAGYAVALVSKLALAVRHSSSQLWLFAADARTGEGRGGVQVMLSGPGAAPAKGTTTAQGALQLKPAARATRALAHADNDWAVLELPSVPGRAKGSRVWVAPTRGEARPGEVLRFVGAERPPPSSARDLTVSLEDGRGTVVATGLARQDVEGVFSGELPLPEESAPGLGHLVVDVEGRAAAGEVWIRDPPVPDLTAAASLQLAGDHATAIVHARDGAGGPVAAHIEWRLLRTPLEASGDGPPITEVVDEGEATGEPDGTSKFDVELPDGPDARFTLSAAAVDGWGHRAPCEATLTKLRGPVHVALTPEHRVVAPGESALIALRASDAEGRPAFAKLTLRATAVRLGPGGEASSAPPSSFSVDVPATGLATVGVPVLQAGYEELEVLAGETRVADGVLFASAHGGDIPFTPDELTLVPDKPSYAPGETARVLLFAPFESGSALVTTELGSDVHGEVVAIHGSSAMLTQKLTSAGGVTFSAVAVLNGQSYSATRTVRVTAAETGHLEAQLQPGPRPDTLELVVHARDAQQRPLANVAPLASWRAAAALPSLAPPLASYLDPDPSAEGRTDVSLEFRSAGQSASAGRPHAPLLGPAAFTPQKGLGTTQARLPHATLDHLERLPPTDRTGTTRLVLPAGDARAVEATVLAALPGPDPRGLPALLSASAQLEAPGVAAIPHLPAAIRASDRALARVGLSTAGAAATALVDGRSLAVPASGSLDATLSLDAQHPDYKIETGGRALLSGRVPVISGEEWVTVQAGEAPSGNVRLGDEGEEGTLRLRVVSGPLGLLRLLADARHAAPRPGAFELLTLPARPKLETDARLSDLSTAVAATALRPDPAGLSAAAAEVVALLEPTGELGAFPGAPYDRSRTALALWLLTRAQNAGAGVPPEWLERVRGRLASDPLKGSGFAMAALALDATPPSLDDNALDALAPESLAALTLLAANHHQDARAAELAARLERKAGAAGNRACWSDEGCDPRTPASIQALGDTAWATLALATARPSSPRIAAGLRYLISARDQAVWGRGESGVLIPLALAAAGKALPDRAGTVHLQASGAGAEARVTPGTSALLYGSGGPAQLKIQGGPVFFELARARAEPAGQAGELRVERKLFRVKRTGDRVERVPLEGKVARGAEVWVELTVTGASPHDVLQIDDRFPAGLTPVAQPGKTDPASELVDRGGAVAFLGDRVHLALVTGDGPATTVAYLARASLAGHYVAPPALAVAGELSGRSAQSELDIEAGPEGSP